MCHACRTCTASLYPVRLRSCGPVFAGQLITHQITHRSLLNVYKDSLHVGCDRLRENALVLSCVNMRCGILLFVMCMRAQVSDFSVCWRHRASQNVGERNFLVKRHALVQVEFHKCLLEFTTNTMWAVLLYAIPGNQPVKTRARATYKRFCCVRRRRWMKSERHVILPTQAASHIFCLSSVLIAQILVLVCTHETPGLHCKMPYE